jgi:hypothetical protein
VKNNDFFVPGQTHIKLDHIDPGHLARKLEGSKSVLRRFARDAAVGNHVR